MYARGLPALGMFYVSVLGVGAGLLLLLVACVTLSSRVKRSAVWINLCVSFILYAVTLSLLFITGWTQGPEPPFRLCLASAALIYAMPVLAGFASLALVLHIWLDHRTMMAGLRGRKCALKNVAFIVVPYIACSGIIVEVVIVGRSQPERVMRYGALPHCGLAGHAQASISGAIVLGVLVAALVLQVLIARSLWRIRARVRLGATVQPVAAGMAMRLACFSAITLLAAISTAVQCRLPKDRAWSDGLICFMPLAMFLIFGTQRDILEGFMFWRKPHASPETIEMN